ncbi:MAG: methionyl-tRNA formyltransferase, partial [Desulfomonilaceae bacterium]
GRGKIVKATPVKLLALESGIEYAEPENLKDPCVIDILNKWKPDAIVVVAYGKFLPIEILNLPSLGCLNLHASLLPRHRGPSPIPAAILAGDAQTGNTVMLMDTGMDTGQILEQQVIEITERESAGDLHDKLMDIGSSLMLETLERWINNRITPIPQDNSKATYSRMLRKSDGLLDWNLDARQLDRIVRAMNPWPGAFFMIGREQIKVWSATPLEGQAEPGLIIDITSHGLTLGTGSGLLRLNEIQAPSRRKVTAVDFARGKRLKSGTYLI